MSGLHLTRALRRRRGPGTAARALVAAPVLAFVVAACSTASGAPGYTYGPAASSGMAQTGAGGPSPSSVPSASPMAMPSASPMAMPPGSGTPPAPPSPAPVPSAPDPSGGTAPAGATAHLSARNIQFDTDHLAVPAGQAWVLAFDNNDAGVPHNVEIRDASGASVFKGRVVTGPTSVSYQVGALAPGTYTFLCDVHPTMTGTITVA